MHAIRSHLHEFFGGLWSSAEFSERELQSYAMTRIERESRYAVAMVSALMLLYLVTAMALTAILGLNTQYLYTNAVLATLALHVLLSVRKMRQIKELHVLAACLLIFCGCASVLVAQQTARIDMMFVVTTVALFVLVPLLPWGMRGALLTVGGLYFMFAVSTLLNHDRFTPNELWLFQFLLLFCASLSILTVLRWQSIRIHDITTQFHLQRTNVEMETMCNQDYLTGTRNRRYLEANFTTIREHQRQHHHASHLAVLDVDHFKSINDRYGHEAGDLALQTIGKAFQSQMAELDCVARLGGDEFAVLLHGESPEVVLQKALAEIAAGIPLDRGREKLSVRCSVGLYTIDRGASLAFQDAYRLADSALYQAKHLGGNQIVHATKSGADTRDPCAP